MDSRVLESLREIKFGLSRVEASICKAKVEASNAVNTLDLLEFVVEAERHQAQSDRQQIVAMLLNQKDRLSSIERALINQKRLSF